MASHAAMEYERVGQKEVKITYNFSDGQRTEVVARVLRPGTYKKCTIEETAEKKCA